MSNLEELKNKLCPNGVEFVKLGEVCSFIYGYTEKAKDEGNVRFVRITDISEVGCLNPEGAKYINLIPECEKYLLKRGDLLTARAGATYGKTLYFDEDYPAVYASYLIKLNFDNNLILNRYYWHFTKSSYYWKQANQLAVGGAQPNLNANSLAKIILPIPPLEVQEEIVRILDPLTKDVNELIDLLKKEQELRKKQYAYYRDKLLTFEEDSLKKRFRDTCIIKSGEFASPKELSKIQDDLHIYPCYGSNGLRGYINKFNYDGEYPIVGRVGALCGSVNYVSGKFFVTDNALIVQSKGEYIPRFLYYLLISLNLNKYKAGGAQPAIAGKTIYDLSAPLPPLEKQKEIVSILDNLEKYYNNLQESLPAEIEKRKKQYEFYRDKLLTF